MLFGGLYAFFAQNHKFLECWRALARIVACFVAFISCSRFVGSASVFMMLVSLVIVRPVPGMWAVGYSFFVLSD